MPLDWPDEIILPQSKKDKWSEPGSNLVLDFHGDPISAKLVVFSDGNHHMALLSVLQAFYTANCDMVDIFYTTTPPAPIVSLLKEGILRLGNLVLSIRPHVFISPPHVLDQLQSDGLIDRHLLLARNQGSVLLIQKHNPKEITGIKDLMHSNVRLFISNPDRETVSYNGYRQSLEEMAEDCGVARDDFNRAVFGETIVWGNRIHHREAPEAVASGSADAAIVYYHLALRYIHIFPNMFDMIPLGGTKDRPIPHPKNRIASIHMGLVGDGGIWGKRLIEFMQSRSVADIYADHGLTHALDL